jgi:membrane protein required for colicin V production
MTLLDGILIVIMLVSALLAMIRGFTREVFSIASWVVAALATYSLWDDLLPITQRYIPDKNLSLGLTVVGIFFITLILVTLVTMKISDFILDSKAGPLDRTLGFLFGAGRGLLLVVIGVLFLNYFIPTEKQWAGIAEARSKPFLDELGSELLNMLPEDPEAAIMDLKPEEGGATPEEGAATDGGAANYATEDRNALERQLETSGQQ